MNANDTPNKAAQVATDAFEYYHSIKIDIKYCSGSDLVVEIDMYSLDSEHCAGVVYELIECGWVLEDLDVRRGVLKTHGSVNELPTYWSNH